MPELRRVRENDARDDRGDRCDRRAAPPPRSDLRPLAGDRGLRGDAVARLLALRRRRRRCPDRNLAARVKTELVADLLDMVLGGALGDEEALRDLTVRQTVGEETGHLSFASGELRRRRPHGVAHILLLPRRRARSRGES